MRRLLLIDGHSLIHRAYHAYPKTLATKTGELTNAVYGFTNILLTAINEIRPTHLAVSFDLPKPTFRQAIFVGYKRSRVKPDDELITQIPRVKEVVRALNIPIYEVEGFEADDVIGTLCRQATETMVKMVESVRMVNNAGSSSHLNNLNPHNNLNHSVIILTSDRDLTQLIRDNIVVVQFPAKGKIPAKIWNQEEFVGEWKFEPKLLPDYKALAGDPSDDIPGVKGIGEKTAKELVTAYGDIDNIYRQLLKGRTLPRQGPTLIEKLADGQDSAQMSKKLATIDTDVPIKLDWEQTEIHEYNKEQVFKLFEELEFRSLSKKLPNDKFEQTVQDALF